LQSHRFVKKKEKKEKTNWDIQSRQIEFLFFSLSIQWVWVPTGFSRKELQLMYRSFKQVNHEARQPLFFFFFFYFTFTADLNSPGVDFAWLLSSERGAILFSSKI
jgi:hypothetical protein